MPTDQIAKPPISRDDVSSPDWDKVREDFPILARPVHGSKRLAYLDNAATAQKPRCVMERLNRYYETENSNIHRGVHALSEAATTAYEGARKTVQAFINASSEKEVIFTRGTTEAINLVANSFGERLGEGDEIVITTLEHHANIIPWQLLAARTGCVLKVVPIGCVLKVVPIDADGIVTTEAVEQTLSDRTKLVAVAHVSNALGHVLPVEEIIAMAKSRNVTTLLDGAQAVPHQSVDVQALGCDFYAFSGHKVCGPTGIGTLYGREALLADMPPWQGGGDMISVVTFEKSTWNELPYKFEAGTPNIAGAIGLAAAIDYVTGIGMDAIAARESALLQYATAHLREIRGLRILGDVLPRAAVLSLVFDGIHPHDAGTILDHCGVAVRAGHHCTHPLMRHFGVPATTRASLAFYNNEADVDQLVESIPRLQRMFGQC
jgi:cysteine desulfurase/selenocysteine lyase